MEREQQEKRYIYFDCSNSFYDEGNPNYIPDGIRLTISVSEKFILDKMRPYEKYVLENLTQDEIEKRIANFIHRRVVELFDMYKNSPDVEFVSLIRAMRLGENCEYFEDSLPLSDEAKNDYRWLCNPEFIAQVRRLYELW